MITLEKKPKLKKVTVGGYVSEEVALVLDSIVDANELKSRCDLISQILEGYVKDYRQG